MQMLFMGLVLDKRHQPATFIKIKLIIQEDDIIKVEPDSFVPSCVLFTITKVPQKKPQQCSILTVRSTKIY